MSRTLMPPANDGLVSKAELADLASVSPKTVERWISMYRMTQGKQGLGPVYYFSRRNVRIPLAAWKLFREKARGGFLD